MALQPLQGMDLWPRGGANGVVELAAPWTGAVAESPQRAPIL